MEQNPTKEKSPFQKDEPFRTGHVSKEYQTPKIKLIHIAPTHICSSSSNLSDDDNNKGTGHNFYWDD